MVVTRGYNQLDTVTGLAYIEIQTTRR